MVLMVLTDHFIMSSTLTGTDQYSIILNPYHMIVHCYKVLPDELYFNSSITNGAKHESNIINGMYWCSNIKTSRITHSLVLIERSTATTYGAQHHMSIHGM